MAHIGLYPGTFDPITNGHLDIIERAAKLFDKLVIGVNQNAEKGPMFSLDERIAMVQRETAHLNTTTEIEVRQFDSLLVHFARDIGARTIVRGLRDGADFGYEYQMTAMNRQLDRNIETIFLMADPRHQAVASSLVKVIARHGGDISAFVSPGIAAQLLDKVRLH
jgi:pantetheine-phosphate adenylyltransferase